METNQTPTAETLRPALAPNPNPYYTGRAFDLPARAVLPESDAWYTVHADGFKPKRTQSPDAYADAVALHTFGHDWSKHGHRVTELAAWGQRVVYGVRGLRLEVAVTAAPAPAPHPDAVAIKAKARNISETLAAPILSAFVDIAAGIFARAWDNLPSNMTPDKAREVAYLAGGEVGLYLGVMVEAGLLVAPAEVGGAYDLSPLGFAAWRMSV